MRCVLVTLLIGFACMSSAVQAGSWPRGKGNLFVSVTQGYSLTYDETYPSIYAEWGLGPRLTLGLDAGGVGSSQRIATFARLSRVAGPGGLVMATEFAVGTADGGQTPFVQSGVLIGIGFDSFAGRAWFDSRTTVDYEITTGYSRAKLDATLGVKTWREILVMAELNAEAAWDEDPKLHIAPGIALPLARAVRIQLGASRGVMNTQEDKVKVSLWFEF